MLQPKDTNIDYDVSIISMDTGYQYNVSNIITSMNLYADMDTVSVHGDVTLKHNVGSKTLIETIPIIGREVLLINGLSCRYQGASPVAVLGQLKFVVYAVDSVLVNGDQIQYTIRFTSPLGIVSPAVRICERYKDKNVFEIIQNILDQCAAKGQSYGFSGGELKLTGSSTQNTIDFFVPNWHPLDAMVWLSKIAASGSIQTDAGAGVADCVLFQPLKHIGEIQLRSYSELNGASSNKLQWTPTNQSSANGTIQEEDFHIVNAQLGSIVDSQKFKMSGIAGAKAYWMDFRPGNMNSGGGNQLTAGITPITFQKVLNMVRSASGGRGINSSLHSMVYSNEFVHKIIPYNIHDEQSKKMWENYVYPGLIYGPALHEAMHLYNAVFQIAVNTNVLQTMNSNSYELDLGVAVEIDKSSDFEGINVFAGIRWIISGVHYSITPRKIELFLNCFGPQSNIGSYFSNVESGLINQAGSEPAQIYQVGGGTAASGGGGFLGGLFG